MAPGRCPTCNSRSPEECWRVNDPRGWEPHPHGGEPTPCCPDEFHKGQTTWTLYICDECGGPGWAFGKGECNPGDYTHKGSHHGPVEVVPLAHVERLREQLHEIRRLTS